jgi:hypothetical protein
VPTPPEPHPTGEEHPDAKQRSGTGESSKVEDKPEEAAAEEEEEESAEVKQEAAPEEEAEPGENEFSGGLDMEETPHGAQASPLPWRAPCP